MGKLLTGRYGESPGAESTLLSLADCHQRLGLKPSDFVSEAVPDFFSKAYNAKGRYLVFQIAADELQGNRIWRPGFYLLPAGAAEVLEALARSRMPTSTTARRLPVEFESSAQPPEVIVARAREWAEASQPLFFKCRCSHLELRLDPPRVLRRRWRARLKCPERCQPALATLL